MREAINPQLELGEVRIEDIDLDLKSALTQHRVRQANWCECSG